MKSLFVLLFSFLIGYDCEGQILRKLGTQVKEDIEWRARRKAGQKIDQGLDSLIAAPKKIADKKAAQKTDTPPPDQQNKKNTTEAKQNNGTKEPPNTIKAAPVEEEEELSTKDGYVTLQLSADKIFTGGGILISGESIQYKNFNQVEITVTGPSGTDVRKITLATGGKYYAGWNASNITGDYTVTVKSSDQKASQSATFSVEELELIFDDEWPEDNIKATNKAYDNLKEAVAKVEGSISPKIKAELDKKMDEVKDKVNDALKLFKDLNTAGKQTAELVKKSGKKLSPGLAGNLSDLNNNLAEHARTMKTFEKYAQHKPQDNTIFEYFVMVNEACAAFSAFTNFWSTSLKTILLNITLDKGVPKAVDIINTKTTKIEAPHDFFPKEIGKIFATSKLDAESLTTKLGKAGIAGDVTQYASDVLLKTYCGVFKGEIKHDYTVDFRNKDGVTWWKYGVVMQGAFTLRYPKDNSNGKIIKMKGNMEGNATKFTFYENIEAEDGFQDGSKGKIEVVELRVLKPPAVPFVSSLNDPAGFGAAARTLVTPACFIINLDAEYDVDANNIKLFVNGALIDFSPAVVNQVIFAEIGGDLFQYIKRMTFPIHKAYRTLSSVLYKNNEFTIDKDAKGNLSFKGKANKHLGSKNDKLEHDLNFSLFAKKD